MPRLRSVAACVLAIGLLSACDSGGGSSSTDTTRSTARPTTGQAGACFSAPVEVGEGGIELTEATEAQGLTKPLLGMYAHASAMADVNGDGWLDLFVGTFADKTDDKYAFRGATVASPDRLLLGGKDGFRPAEGFPDQYGRTTGAAFVDLDGDADLDLVIARNAKQGKQKAGRRALAGSVILRNDGDSWEQAAEIAAQKGARAVVALDYDEDGKLDLFVEEDRFTGGASVLLRNEGDFTFKDVTAAAGLPSDLNGLGAAAADFNRDGRQDLFVTGDNRMFLHTGAKKFEEATSKVFAWEEFGPEDDVAGIDVADLNRDGGPDIVLGQHYNSTLSAARKVPVRIYLHRGVEDGVPSYEDVTDKAGVAAFPTKAPHVEIQDFDNDGWPDILATASVSDGSQPAILRSEGAEPGGVPTFAGVSGAGNAQYWVSGGVGDVDHDGRLDVFVVEFEPNKPSLLFRNQSSGGHWLEVGLAPDKAVGSVVEVYPAGAAGQAAELLTRREVITGVGYAAGATNVVHVGLGDVTKVDVRVTVRGEEPVDLRGLAADQRVRFPGDC